MNNTNSKKIFNRAKKVIPGGVNSPVRAFGSVGMDYPIFIKKGDGSKIYDEDDNKYIDYICSWGPLILGHNNKRVLEGVKEAIELGSSFGLPTKKEVDLAELIVDMVPSIDKVRLTTSGTEAAMAGVRLARAYTGKKKILKFEGCYHGHSDSLLVKAGSGLLTQGDMDSNGIISEIADNTLIAKYNNLEDVRNVFKKEGDDIAAVIIEPIAANMGLIEPSKKFIKGLRELTQANDTLLIFDEVISGFRVSPGGAQEYFDIEPDITILGKIIGGGYPIGAFGGKEDIMNMVAPVGDVYHAGTLSGNPVSVRAGIETLKELSENKGLYKELDSKAKKLVDGIKGVAKKRGIDININRLGSLFTIFFAKGDIATLDDVQKSDLDRYSVMFQKLLENGVVIPPSPYEANFVSIAHSDSDIQYTIEQYEKVFGELND